jgi:hypothetical protein
MSAATEGRHYHLDDYPLALGVLGKVAYARDLSAIGYEPTEHGAFVNWDALANSWLSSTERATVAIAQGVALAERHGGLPTRVSPAVRHAVTELTRVRGPRSGPDDYPLMTQAEREHEAARLNGLTVYALGAELGALAHELDTEAEPAGLCSRDQINHIWAAADLLRPAAAGSISSTRALELVPMQPVDLVMALSRWMITDEIHDHGVFHPKDGELLRSAIRRILDGLGIGPKSVQREQQGGSS